MALQKQSFPINFSQGLDTKSDPFQVAPGKFLALANTIFTKGGLLQKRNGFATLTSLPDTSSTLISTFNGNLTAIGSTLEAYSSSNATWSDKGNIQPANLAVMPLIRSSTNQSQADSAISPNGLVCTVYTDNIPDGVGGSNPSYRYVVADAVTGQNIVVPTIIVPTLGTVDTAPKVWRVGNYFVIVFGVLIVGHSLEYIAISTLSPTQVTSSVSLSPQFNPVSTGSFDGAVVNNALYLAWNGSDIGGAIRMTSLNYTLQQSNTVSFLGHAASIISVTIDDTGNTPAIYASFWASGTSNGYTLAVDQILNTILAPTQIISGESVANITNAAQNGVNTVIYEVNNNYSYDASIPTHFLKQRTITQAGVLGTAGVVVRSLGLASQAFIINNAIYVLGMYDSLFQPTYFLVNLSGNVIVKLAYSNGGSYYTTGLPEVSVNGNLAQVAYLTKDLIAPVNKTQGLTNAAGIYSQTGINLASITLQTSGIITSEIGANLNFTGGFLWAYDGFKPVEQGFHLWPDYVETTLHNTGGGLQAQQYFYVATYEWSDNQGNVFRSAPSIPVEADLSTVSPSAITFTSIFASGTKTITVSSIANLFVGQYITDNTTSANIPVNTYITAINGLVLTLSQATAGASAGGGDTLQTDNTGSVTVNVPTLRLTYKTVNPVTIVVYRWSAAQQTYYQVTSLQIPILNDTTIDSIAYVDRAPDLAILGNEILYTTGGVLENIGAPANSTMTLFQSRLFLVDSEDRNLLWFSKQVIENVPVEMSDLLTIYVAPTTAAQGSTGPITALSALDDKLIVFKKDAIYYITGVGPDNTGANNQFSEPIFITATVGCANQQSIVFMPQGLMFQSDKGIWLLGRDLSTSYIGAAVEQFNTSLVKAALNIPGTNQVRFTLDSGITLMYDYYFNQWGTFLNIPAISSTLYQGLHTYLNAAGAVLQESPGIYIDATNPVLMSFTTSWLNLAGLQGFERAYFFYLLGTYLSPHKLQLEIAYDYNSGPSQSVIITPDNFSYPYGEDGIYGNGTPYGDAQQLEQWRIFFNQQKCQSFQISMTEVFDSSYNTIAGAGLTISGLDLVVGVKSTYPRLKAARSIG